MPAVALSGNDTININNQVLVGLADANAVEITFPNEIANVKIGKNGNAIYGLNTTGQQSECKIRVLRGSADDKFLNNLWTQQQNNFSGTVLLLGQFIKKIGDGQGNITSDTYIMSGGVFTKGIDAKTNVEGDVDQSVSVYTIKFANSPAIRVLT
jgi:hypothetical protein